MIPEPRNAAARMPERAPDDPSPFRTHALARTQAFSLHQLCHAYNLQRHGIIIDPAGMVPRGAAKKSRL